MRESQEFFYDLMSTPNLIGLMRKNRVQVLKNYFHSSKDREALSKIPLERFQTYRNHITYGILGGIASSFPVLRSLVSEKEWNELLNSFYLKRLTKSPIARRVYGEFAHYIEKKYRGPLLKRMPYLKELAHYENLELSIFYEKDIPLPKGLISHKKVFTESSEKSAARLLSLKPILNSHLAVRVYRWPVHRICLEYSAVTKVHPGIFPLLVYRDHEGEVRFMESNPLVAQLLKMMKLGKTKIGVLLKDLLKTEKHTTDLIGFVREAITTIRFLSEKGVIAGFRK